MSRPIGKIIGSLDSLIAVINNRIDSMQTQYKTLSYASEDLEDVIEELKSDNARKTEALRRARERLSRYSSESLTEDALIEDLDTIINEVLEEK